MVHTAGFLFVAIYFLCCLYCALVEGTAARAAACTMDVDKWCLAQAKDLEIREEVYFIQ